MDGYAIIRFSATYDGASESMIRGSRPFLLCTTKSEFQEILVRPLTVVCSPRVHSSFDSLCDSYRHFLLTEEKEESMPVG